MAILSDRVHTFGHAMLARHGERVHKIALDAGFTCPNRDGTKGIGGCSFCNNQFFHSQEAGRGCKDAEASTTTHALGAHDPAPLAAQFERARPHPATHRRSKGRRGAVDRHAARLRAAAW